MSGSQQARELPEFIMIQCPLWIPSIVEGREMQVVACSFPHQPIYFITGFGIHSGFRLECLRPQFSQRIDVQNQKDVDGRFIGRHGTLYYEFGGDGVIVIHGDGSRSAFGIGNIIRITNPFDEVTVLLSCRRKVYNHPFIIGEGPLSGGDHFATLGARDGQVVLWYLIIPSTADKAHAQS